MPVNEIWERERINGEEHIIWCRAENGRTKYWVTRGTFGETVVKPTSRKRCYEWLAEHRVHGHTPTEAS